MKAILMRSRRALMSSPPSSGPVETEFTFIAIPDTQRETNSSSGATRFTQRMQWIVDNAEDMNLKYVVQNGDLTDWDTPDHIHYVRADAGLDILDAAGIQYALSIGNHDTAAVAPGGSAAPGDTNANLRITTTFNDYFGLDRYPYIIGSYPAGKVDNAYRTFTAGGLNFLVMNLELWPRNAVYTWANNIIQAHPNHNVMLVTHMFLNGNGTLSTSNGGYGDTSPQQMYDAIIRDNENVKFTFSGHTGTWAHLVSTSGTTGHKTYHISDCWHDESTNPMRICAFNIPAGTITSQVFLPQSGTWRADTNVNISGIEWVT